MRVVVSALIALSLVLVIGCDKNDENTINPIPKYHNVYPVFRVKIDNGFRKFGVDSAQLIPTPGIGWRGPAYTDVNGFLGTMAAGTEIISIDTISEGDSIYIDTTWVSPVPGFGPSQTYNFAFVRNEPFIWQDSFLAVYAYTVDSLWVLLAADTVEVTRRRDTTLPIDTVLYQVVANPEPTLIPPPDSTSYQDLLLGYWFDTARVIADPDDTVGFPPDSTRDSTVMWGFWHRIDTFFLPDDSSIWCNLDSMVVVESTHYDVNGFPSIVTESVYYYSSCNPTIDTVEERVYNHWGWGVYPAGDTTEPPLASYDTTLHFTFPDTAKQLVFDGSGLSIMVPDVIGPGPADTTWKTVPAEIELIHNGSNMYLDSLRIDLAMPPVEIYPQYDFIIRQVTP